MLYEGMKPTGIQPNDIMVFNLETMTVEFWREKPVRVALTAQPSENGVQQPSPVPPTDPLRLAESLAGIYSHTVSGARILKERTTDKIVTMIFY